jgi:selenide,water dikinase
VLVSPFSAHHYSSMVPGYLQGRYREAELAFDLAALCRAARARFVEGYAERVDGGARTVSVEGRRIDFDVASLDVGSDPSGLEVPGAREHALTVRPLSRAVALEARLAALAREPRDGPVPVCVVGGGAAGAEVAWAVQRRLALAGRASAVVLVERARELLPEYTPAARRAARGLLEGRGVRIVLGQEVAAVTPDAVALADGTTLPSALTLWLTGAAPERGHARLRAGQGRARLHPRGRHAAGGGRRAGVGGGRLRDAARPPRTPRRRGCTRCARPRCSPRTCAPRAPGRRR